jgi:hypothetical protein
MNASGQIRIPTAGTPVRLDTQPANCPVMVKALDTNTGVIVVGGEGVALNSGLRLLPGEAVVLDYVGNLSNLWLNASVNSEGAAWLMLHV